jgi:hypothetical protein
VERLQRLDDVLVELEVDVVGEVQALGDVVQLDVDAEDLLDLTEGVGDVVVRTRLEQPGVVREQRFEPEDLGLD